MHTPTDPKLMSAAELAECLGVRLNTAYALLHRSDFPSVKIGALLFALRAEVRAVSVVSRKSRSMNALIKTSPC